MEINPIWFEVSEALRKDAVIPLYNKDWVIQTIKDEYIKEYVDDMPLGEILEQMEEELEFEKYSIDGSIIVGCPEMDEDEYAPFAFGLKSEGYLDDGSFLEYLTNKYWRKLSEAGLIDLRSMESCCGLFKPKWMNEFKDKEAWKHVRNFITGIIGESLTDPNNKIKGANTNDCKAFLTETFGPAKYKRVKKRTWGELEFRLFTDGNDEYFTVVVHKDNIISFYGFSFEDY